MVRLCKVCKSYLYNIISFVCALILFHKKLMGFLVEARLVEIPPAVFKIFGDFGVNFGGDFWI